jgi:predicted house-cleaning noncanonical NTP pyrophosphatase (MazG superfamily)
LITESGGQPQTREARGEEYPALLRLKLLEEVQEFLDSDDAEELVDVIEVVHALARDKGVEPERLEELRAAKEREKGGFLTRTVLMTAPEEAAEPDQDDVPPAVSPGPAPPAGAIGADAVPGTPRAASGGTVYRGSSSVPGHGWSEVAGSAH